MNRKSPLVEPVSILGLEELSQLDPTHAVIEDVDLVLIRDGEEISVLYGRCLHRGALLSDGHIDGKNLICGLHGWDYQLRHRSFRIQQ